MSDLEISSDERRNSEYESYGSNSDYVVVELGAVEPYQDEPLAVNRRRPRMAEDGDDGLDNGRAENEDPDGISIATLESRYEKRSPVGQWYVIYFKFETIFFLKR